MKTFQGSYDSDIYPKEAVLKAAYAFIGDYYLHIRLEGKLYIVDITPKDEVGTESVIREFENELLAATLRLQIYQRTHVLREIMLARAMASTMIVDESVNTEEDEDSAGVSLSEITKDWFEHEQTL